MTVKPFDEFFREATATAGASDGYPPHGYQARLARDGLPAVIEAPTGTGKTGVILAWLWRRLHGPDPERTPRRLVFALPQRTLVEQVAREAGRWLENLGLAEEIALHVVMGGAGETQRQWRLDMHRPAIVVGTIDSLVSKALNRGYGIGRASYPIDFALVTNGAHWIIDEIQLCPESTTTLRQLAAFTASMETAEPFGLTCMSATIPGDLLSTVNNPDVGRVIRIEPSERTGDLAARLSGQRTVQRLPAEPENYTQIAEAIRARHRPGSLTLAVFNTVDAARQVFGSVNGTGVPSTLVHSRFRGVERERLISSITSPLGQEGRIVVATQVVEAGIDLNAAVLFTEAAPWPSIVQRVGRCNRSGRIDDAELWWLPPVKPAPYPEADVDAAAAELARLEGERVTSENLLEREVAATSVQVTVLRRPDLISLFDTSADLSGADIDIAPYVRDADDLDVQLAWAIWASSEDGAAPPAPAKAPEAKWRCRVPLGQLDGLIKQGVTVWRLDQAAGGWAKVTRDSRARPGEVLVVNAAEGRYDQDAGFDPTSRRPVPGCPELLSPLDLAAGAEDSFRDDSASLDQDWLSLERHSEDVRAQVEALLTALRPELPQTAAEAAIRAGYAHDAGKWHPIWQDALCDLAGPERAIDIQFRRPWAKSGGTGRLVFAGGVAFRHELASLLLIDGPLRGLLDGPVDDDLVRYLVLAHHGKLRIQVREPTDSDPGILLGLRQDAVEAVPPLLGQLAGELKVDLAQFWLGGDQSWTRTALRLRDRYGPFVLAYLETVVRIADWRASAGMEAAR